MDQETMVKEKYLLASKLIMDDGGPVTKPSQSMFGKDAKPSFFMVMS